MPTLRDSGIVHAYNGGGGVTVNRAITAQVGDTVVLLVGIDYANGGGPVPDPSSAGITFTVRTTKGISGSGGDWPLNTNVGYAWVATGVVTANNPTFSAGTGSRDASITVAYYVLPGAWTFVGAASTGPVTTASNTQNAPSVSGAQSSPRTRGWSFDDLSDRALRVVVPADAGVVPHRRTS